MIPIRSVRSVVLVTSCGIVFSGLTLAAQDGNRSSPGITDQDQFIRQWTSALRTGELQARRDAAVALRTTTPSALHDLLPDFIDIIRYEKDGQIRLAILDVLTDMGPQAAEAVPALALAMRQDMNRSRTEERHQDFRAAIALSHIGKPAVEVLRNLLTEESEGLRAEATAALGRIGPDASAALADLVRMLGDDSPRVRDDAAIAVGNMGIAAFAPLLTAIGKNASKASNSEANVNETSARAKAAAVRALGELLKQTAPEEPSEVQSVLESAVGDPDAEVRAQAVQAIVQSGLEDARVDELLIHSLQDTVESVSVAATNALATRAAMIRRTSTELAKLLRDSHDHAARQAAFLLHFLGDDGATLLLNASQHSDSRIEHIAHSLALIGQPIASRLTAHLDSSDPRLRQVAVLALGEMRPLPQDVVAKLAERLPSEDPQVQISILHALASLGNRATNAVDAVRELKNDPRDAVRLQVIDVLFSAAPKDAKLVSELTSMIGDTQPQVQERAIERITALGPIGVRAVDDVLPQLDSENDGVRRAAAAMLASFGRSAQAAVPQLIKHLHGDDLSWRLFVIAILGQFGETAQPARAELSQLIQDPAPDVRAAALQALANLQLDPSEIRGELYSALNDSEQAVVDVALSTIRRLGRRGMIFIPDLIPLLAREDIQESVSRLLDRFDRYSTDVDSVPQLLELLQHPNARIRTASVRFLGLAGPVAAAALPSLELLATDGDETLHAAVVEAISKIRDQSTSPEAS